jgi:selT/selW/selH-like putative selenoprotein
VKVTLRPGRTSSFEVTLDDELIHSRLGGQGWPDTESLLQLIAKRIGP